MTDEVEVTTRHKNLLRKIRKEHPVDERSDGHFGARDEEIRTPEQEYPRAERDPGEYQGEGRGTGRGDREGPERADRQAGVGRGSDSRIGPLDTKDQYATQGDDPVEREVGTGEGVASPSPWEIEDEEGAKEKAERRKELARQRQQRHREKQRGESSTEASPLRDVEKKDVTFSLKNIFKSDATKEPDKPLLMKEADDETRKKLIDLYVRGSSILDDVLEILVKDHEPVQIWELSAEEAEMLVDMQLERARKSAAEARVVRKLVAIYDRLFFAMLIGPRVKATLSHIDSHGGVSFR